MTTTPAAALTKMEMVSLLLMDLELVTNTAALLPWMEPLQTPEPPPSHTFHTRKKSVMTLKLSLRTFLDQGWAGNPGTGNP
jgi:hypothetical protein